MKCGNKRKGDLRIRQQKMKNKRREREIIIKEGNLGKD